MKKDDWGSQIFPPDGNIISRTATTTQTDTKNESDPPVVETKLTLQQALSHRLQQQYLGSLKQTLNMKTLLHS